MQKVALNVENLCMQFGGLKAVDQVSFQIESGSLVGLIGPNGAGKTTLFNMLTGVYKPSSGKIELATENEEFTSLVGKKPWQISQLGVSRTFQNIRLFKNLSVLENVLISCFKHAKTGLFGTLLQTASFLKEEKDLNDMALSLLEIFNLTHLQGSKAGSLPYGEQRKLEIVRALATKPKLIMLDEPAAGMNHQETDELMHLIGKIRKEFALTVILIEHDMKLVMGICERILVLDHGVKIAEGTPSEVRNNRQVIRAYLGEDEETLGVHP